MYWNSFSKYQKFLNQNILAIDYGTKVTGLASYRPGHDPYPLLYGKIVYQSDQELIHQLKNIVQLENVEILVLGLPKYLDGNKSQMTQRIEDFGALLKKSVSHCSLYMQDETLSTSEAKERMQRDPRFNFKIDMKQIDALAACIILEDFIKDPQEFIL